MEVMLRKREKKERKKEREKKKIRKKQYRWLKMKGYVQIYFQ